MNTDFCKLLEICQQVFGTQNVLEDDEQTVFAVNFQDQSVYFISTDDASIFIRMPLGQCNDLTQKKEFYEELLSANLFGNGTEGATLSLKTNDDGIDELWLGERLDPTELLEEKLLVDFCDTMLQVASDWKKRLELYQNANVPNKEEL